MDRGKRTGNLIGSRSNRLYMDLKDIIRENALQFLPAKSLARFQSVCRDWKFQISTPLFVHNQSLSCDAVLGFFYQASGKAPSLICIDPKSCGVPDASLSFLPEPVDIKSSSNGLLLCQGKAGDRAYYICNPMTQQWKKLPKPNADHGKQPAVVLIFEPSRLIFDADYKIICPFASSDFDDATEFEIYSSKEGSWKISGEISFAPHKFDPKSGVHANGIVYWKGRDLLSYDLNKDRSQLLSHYSTGILGTIDGKLCVASNNGPTVVVSLLENVHSNTMQMNSSSRLWKGKESFRIGTAMLGGDKFFDLIAARDNFLLIKSGEALYYYDCQTKEAKALADTSKVSKNSNAICLPYVNNFASL